MPTKPEDAIELLEASHRSVEQGFEQFRLLSAQGAAVPRRKALADQICVALTIHARLEEEIFYPGVRESIRDENLLDDAEEEHAASRELIGQILGLDPEDDSLDSKVTALAACIECHVGKEREKMFPRVRGSALDLDGLGERLRLREQELQVVSEALREEALASMLT